jgi:hypothetical protein
MKWAVVLMSVAFFICLLYTGWGSDHGLGTGLIFALIVACCILFMAAILLWMVVGKAY